jgi:GNAT superfamily N-acetyltransferase
MLFRTAIPGDIPQIQVVRNAVKENTLSDPSLVTDGDCFEFITRRGKGWVCEKEGRILGFAIADLEEDNIWALFVDPQWERMGIGRELHRLMLGWYFGQGKDHVWLSTAPGTRAERFYRNYGWIEAGMHGSKEIRFELDRERYLGISARTEN